MKKTYSKTPDVFWEENNHVDNAVVAVIMSTKVDQANWITARQISSSDYILPKGDGPVVITHLLNKTNI